MARTKKISTVLESAQTRLAALNSIDPKLSLGTGLGISDYDAQISCTRTARNVSMIRDNWFERLV